MEIKYFKKMLKVKKIDGTENIPMSVEEITGIEEKIGKKFPEAYREFLYLGGKGANMLRDLNHQLISFSGLVHWEEQQQYCRAGMAEEGITIERDFWVFADLDSEQFDFFYFDDGDDPPIYYYSSFHVDDNGKEYAGIKPHGMTFSEYINTLIDGENQ